MDMFTWTTVSGVFIGWVGVVTSHFTSERFASTASSVFNFRLESVPPPFCPPIVQVRKSWPIVEFCPDAVVTAKILRPSLVPCGMHLRPTTTIKGNPHDNSRHISPSSGRGCKSCCGQKHKSTVRAVKRHQNIGKRAKFREVTFTRANLPGATATTDGSDACWCSDQQRSASPRVSLARSDCHILLGCHRDHR